jgi:1-acyl-sn-glycerol-3-phosphate acyltransferase
MKKVIFSIFSNVLYYGIAFPILNIVIKIIYNLKIEGKENIKNLKSGAVTVSNHVLVLDCAMIGLACGKRKVCYTVQEKSFKIPFVGKLIKLLNAIPIPIKIEDKKDFIREVDMRLQKGKIVHFYPEGSLIPYHDKIREFRKGAFDFATKNQVPVVPMVFQFREPKGIRKVFKRKKDVTLTILKPIMCEENSKELKEKVYKEICNKNVTKMK